MEQDKGLFRTSPEAYGAEYRQHLLEQYKLFVEAADRVSARRTSANNYLLTVNAFLVTLYGLASSFGHNQAWVLVVPAAGVLVCITWLALIRSYRNLNTAKFKVIHELEEQLPVALFDREWDHAQRGEGKAYKPLTHIEPYIPLVFAALYVILAVCALVGQPAKTPSSLNLPPTTTAAVRPVAALNTALATAHVPTTQEAARSWVASGQGIDITIATPVWSRPIQLAAGR